MTGKELRELARAVLAEQLRAELVEPERVHAAAQALSLPMDPDEEREAHRKHVAELNANMPVASVEMHAGGLDQNMAKQAGQFGTRQWLP